MILVLAYRENSSDREGKGLRSHVGTVLHTVLVSFWSYEKAFSPKSSLGRKGFLCLILRGLNQVVKSEQELEAGTS